MKSFIYRISFLLLVTLGLGGCEDGANYDFSSIEGKWVAQRTHTKEAIAVFTVIKEGVILSRYANEDGSEISRNSIDADMLNGILRLNAKSNGGTLMALDSTGTKLSCTNCQGEPRYGIWVRADAAKLWEVKNPGEVGSSFVLRGYKYALDLAGHPTIVGY